MAMSASRKSAPRRAAGPAPDAAPEAPADPDPGAAEAADAPLNRAERRGRAKKGANPPISGRGKVVGKSTGVQGPRLYSNRRGGG
jgi:hypothetical protein